jgi:MFS family permease
MTTEVASRNPLNPRSRRSALYPSSTAFGAYWLGQTVSILGSNVTLVVMPWIVLNETHSALTTSATMALEFVPYLFLSIPLGWLADRWNRKQLMMVANLARASLLASIPIVSYHHPVSMAHLYAVTLAMSVFSIVFQSANAAAIPNLVPRERLTSANQLMQAGIAFGSTFGSPLGGLLMSWLSPASTLWIDSLSYVFAALCLFAIRGDFRSRSGKAQSGKFGILEGAVFIQKSPILRWNAVVTAMSNFGSQLSFGVLIFYAKQGLHLSSHAVGWILGVWGVGMFAGSWLSKAIGSVLPSGRILLLSRVVSFVGQILFASSHNAYGLGLASCFNGLSMALFNVQSTTLKQLLIPDHLRGRVASVHQMIGWITIPIGLLAGGTMTSFIGAGGVFTCAAVIQLVSAGLIWRSPIFHFRTTPEGKI